MVRMRNIFRVYSALHQWCFWVQHYVLVCLPWTISLITELHPSFHPLSLDIEPLLRRNFLHSEDNVLKFSFLSLRRQIKLNSLNFKNKLCEIKANLKYKLAESFCRNFALQSRNIVKTIFAVFIESKEVNSIWWKNSFNIFCEAKKMKTLKS